MEIIVVIKETKVIWCCWNISNIYSVLEASVCDIYWNVWSFINYLPEGKFDQKKYSSEEEAIFKIILFVVFPTTHVTIVNDQ